MRVSQEIIAEALEWHRNTQTPISQNIFRYGTEAWGALVREARKLYELGEITELDEDDFYLLESDAGELAVFDGQEVMLDTPQPDFTRENTFIVYVRAGLEIKRIEVEGSLTESKE